MTEVSSCFREIIQPIVVRVSHSPVSFKSNDIFLVEELNCSLLIPCAISKQQQPWMQHNEARIVIVSRSQIPGDSMLRSVQHGKVQYGCLKSKTMECVKDGNERWSAFQNDLRNDYSQYIDVSSSMLLRGGSGDRCTPLQASGNNSSGRPIGCRNTLSRNRSLV